MAHIRSLSAVSETSPKRRFSTSEGRQKFPELLQEAFGDKMVLGFDRYGRLIGLICPPEALHLLADHPESVDRNVADLIKRSANALRNEWMDPAPTPTLVSLDQIEAARAGTKAEKKDAPAKRKRSA